MEAADSFKMLVVIQILCHLGVCFSPQGYNLPLEYTKLAAEFSQGKNNNKNAVWICKPIGQSQGRGIFLFKVSWSCWCIKIYERVQKYSFCLSELFSPSVSWLFACYLVQDWAETRAIINKVMNLRVPYRAGSFWFVSYVVTLWIIMAFIA